MSSLLPGRKLTVMVSDTDSTESRTTPKTGLRHVWRIVLPPVDNSDSRAKSVKGKGKGAGHALAALSSPSPSCGAMCPDVEFLQL